MVPQQGHKTRWGLHYLGINCCQSPAQRGQRSHHLHLAYPAGHWWTDSIVRLGRNRKKDLIRINRKEPSSIETKYFSCSAVGLVCRETLMVCSCSEMWKYDKEVILRRFGILQKGWEKNPTPFYLIFQFSLPSQYIRNLNALNILVMDFIYLL